MAATEPPLPPKIDSSVPHPARIYDWLLGGSVNFEVDREAAQHISSAYPGGMDAACADIRANRVFLVDTVRYAAAAGGVRQFLDIGTGIPNEDNVHAVALETAPESRIVYVDYDPLVLAHAHQLLRSGPDGSTTFILKDLQEPAEILAAAADSLDFTEPVALMLVGILHYVADEDDPYGIVRELVDALCPGSFLVISHLASDINADDMAEMAKRAGTRTKEGGVLRDHGQVLQFFEATKMVEPGLVPVDQWQRETTSGDRTVPIYGGVGRK
jgi:SAM-dependent methyltransferase